MNLSVFNIKRQGIYKKFPNFEFYVKHLDNSDAQIFLDLLDRYIQDGDFQYEAEFGTFDYNIMYAFNGLESYLQRLKQESFSDFYTQNIFNENLFLGSITATDMAKSRHTEMMGFSSVIKF